MSEQITVVDRYSATGTPYPNPKTMCEGQCEGMGVVPIYMSEDVKSKKSSLLGEDETDPKFIALWRESHKYWRLRQVIYLLKNPFDLWRWGNAFGRFDGYHFVICPDCAGTRLKPSKKKDKEKIEPYCESAG